jgi:CheY-like chemotaxis protein
MRGETPINSRAITIMYRVLVIEDNDAIRQMVRRTLVAAGYEVQEAANGEAGVECYRQQRSDVVITDIVMPDSEGLETIRALCRYDAGVKIIAMSGGGRGRSNEYLELAGRFGARRTLSKPFTGDDLRNAVAEVLASVT